MGGNVLVTGDRGTSVRCWSLIFSNAVIRLSDWTPVIFPSACCSRKRLPTGESPATSRSRRRGSRGRGGSHPPGCPFQRPLGRTGPFADGGHQSRCDRAAGRTGQASGRAPLHLFVQPEHVRGIRHRCRTGRGAEREEPLDGLRPHEVGSRVCAERAGGRRFPGGLFPPLDGVRGQSPAALRHRVQQPGGLRLHHGTDRDQERRHALAAGHPRPRRVARPSWPAWKRLPS